MSNNKATNVPWPPIVSSCPDYWTDTPDEPPPETISTYVQTCKTSNGNECNWTNTTTGISCNKGEINCASNGCTCTGEWIENPNPSYTNYIPQPHVPGSRCIGTMGQNTGNYPFNAVNSKCSDKTLTSCDLGTCDNCKTATMNFTKSDGDTNYTGANGNCNKKNWAKNHGNISWDGITYGFGEQNPCWTP